jgi:hypothetical protein
MEILFPALPNYKWTHCLPDRLDSELRRWIGVDIESENLTQQPRSEVKSLGELLLPFPATKPPFHKLKPKRKQPM